MEDGTMAATTTQAAARWLRHYAQLHGGTPSDLEAAMIKQLPPAHIPSLAVLAEGTLHLPSIAEVARAL
eukprot:15475405-Alexandrium_andersonii.AAC.1